MLKGREILSLPVVSLDDRKEIGEVKDIIYNPVESKILGYLVDSGGWFTEAKGFPHSELIKMEEDCLVIRNESVIKKISLIREIKNAIDGKVDIRGFKVECEDGRCIGVIQDLLLDENSWQITGYEISDGVIQDLLDGRSSISNQGISILPDKVVTSEMGNLFGKGNDYELSGLR